MLRERIVTALIMAGLLFAAIAFLSLPWLAGALCVVVSLGGWEWSRMAGWESLAGRVLYVITLVAITALFYFYCELGSSPAKNQVQPFLGMACLWWSFALLWVKAYPASSVFWRTRVMRSLMGFLVLGFGWLAAVYLLSFPRGGLLLVVMVAIVVSADVGAYFSGKAFGKHKLALEVSPNKTWEGFWGGMAAAAALSILLWWMLPNQMSHLDVSAVVAVTLSTAMASVVGDLTVSMVKRESGIKDSGSLLPGHGGILDRLDSLTAAAPVFALGLLLAGV